MLRQKLLKHTEHTMNPSERCAAAQLRHPKMGFHLVGQSFGVHATPFFWACRGCHGVLLTNWMCMDVGIIMYNWCSPSSQSFGLRSSQIAVFLWSALNSMGGVLRILQGFFDDSDDLPSNHCWLAGIQLFQLAYGLQSNPAVQGCQTLTSQTSRHISQAPWDQLKILPTSVVAFSFSWTQLLIGPVQDAANPARMQFNAIQAAAKSIRRPSGDLHSSPPPKKSSAYATSTYLYSSTVINHHQPMPVAEELAPES